MVSELPEDHPARTEYADLILRAAAPGNLVKFVRPHAKPWTDPIRDLSVAVQLLATTLRADAKEVHDLAEKARKAVEE